MEKESYRWLGDLSGFLRFTHIMKVIVWIFTHIVIFVALCEWNAGLLEVQKSLGCYYCGRECGESIDPLIGHHYLVAVSLTLYLHKVKLISAFLCAIVAQILSPDA